MTKRTVIPIIVAILLASVVLGPLIVSRHPKVVRGDGTSAQSPDGQRRASFYRMIAVHDKGFVETYWEFEVSKIRPFLKRKTRTIRIEEADVWPGVPTESDFRWDVGTNAVGVVVGSRIRCVSLE